MTNMSSSHSAGRPPARLFLLWLFILLSSLPAFSAFTVCNQSDQKTYIALGYQENGQWYSRGWWAAEAGECLELLPSLSTRYYYLYAYHAEGGLWAGETAFCTEEENFTLPKGPGCATRFFRVDTQDQPQWTHFLHRDGERYYTTGDGRCDLVSQLAVRTAPYVERFANQFFSTPALVRHQETTIGPDASFQFAVVNDGPVRVRAGMARIDSRDLILEAPLRVTGARLRWRVESDGIKTWRLEKIPDQTTSVKIRLNFQYRNGHLVVSNIDYLQWTRDPFYYFMDEKMALSQLIRSSLEPVLRQMNQAWLIRFRPIFASFQRRECGWREEVAKAVYALRAYDRSREKVRERRHSKSLAKKG